MITIDKLTLDFKTEHLGFAQDLYASWDSFFQNSIEFVLNNQLATLNDENSMITIDTLNVEVGIIPEDEFYQSFANRFAEALQYQIQHLYLQHKLGTNINGIEKKSISVSQIDALIYFLHHGYISSELQTNSNQTLDFLKKIHFDEKNYFLNKFQSGWKFANFRNRLVLQYNDEELLLLVSTLHDCDVEYLKLIVQNNSPFYSVVEKNNISTSAYRSALWIFIISYLFETQENTFYRKPFLAFIINQLSAHYHLKKQEVLFDICDTAEKQQNNSLSADLNQLKIEHTTDVVDKNTTVSIDIIAENIIQKSTSDTEKETAVKTETIEVDKEEKEIVLKEAQVLNMPKTDNQLNITALETNKESVSDSEFNRIIPFNITVAEQKYKSDNYEDNNSQSLNKSEKQTEITQQKQAEEESNLENESTQISSNDTCSSLTEIEVPTEATQRNALNEETTDVANIDSDAHNQNITKNESRLKYDYSDENKDVHLYISNAGLVLLSPYFPRLFSILGLTENGQFISQEAQIKAIFILQQLLFDDWKQFLETDLILNKILVGLALDIHPLPLHITISDNEKETCANLLEGVKHNWNKMRNTSRNGIQEAFLRRDGILENTENGWHLTVEEKTYDILLDTLPWTFKTIKHTWMTEIVHVQWR